MLKKKKTKEAKKRLETFRVIAPRKLTPMEKRDVEEKLKQIIKTTTNGNM